LSEKRLEDLTDEELILDFQQNDTLRAFEILVQRYKNPLMNFVYRFLGDYDTCSDIVQEAMIRVYNNKKYYKSFAKFSTWVYTIAGNLAKTELQRKNKKKNISINSYGDDNETLEIRDERYRPDVIVDSEIKGEIIQEALLKVAEVYREMVILRDIQELSYEEIAYITGVDIGTVKSRINRGRTKLKELLKDIHNE
jgi:RNA polymerase sigma-70 factor (ECF subfamily)